MAGAADVAGAEGRLQVLDVLGGVAEGVPWMAVCLTALGWIHRKRAVGWTARSDSRKRQIHPRR